MNPKIVLFDIETSPSRGYFFGNIWETNIIKVDQDWVFLSVSWKVLGQDKVYYKDLSDFPGYKPGDLDDKALAQVIWDLLDDCDIAIAHNGDGFDVPMSNVRFLHHGLTPPRPYKTIDTKKIAKGAFRFTSNSLDDLASHFDFEGKTAHTGKKLWFDCMDGDPKAWALMKKYNIQDVRLLERVYLHMRPWAKIHVNPNAMSGVDGCRICQSANVSRRGYSFTTTGRTQRFQCRDCGAWSHGKSETVVTLR